MKRILSLLMLIAMLASLFVLSPAALATGDDPAPTETPAAPTATPQPTAAPTATPQPTAAPTATPQPTAAPTATPQPTAAATAGPLTELTKVTTTLDRTPVVLMPVSDCHGTVSSRHASFVSLTWYDSSNKALSASAKFEYKTYRMEIRAKADEGYYFSSNLAGYLNNSAATVTVSADGQYATVSREYEALVFAPRVIKHPGEETVDEGKYVSYVSTAAYANSLSWEFISPDGETVFDSKDIAKTFRSSNCSNDGVQKLVIYNVPMEMNGWSVRAVFTGAQNTVTRSNPVTIKVNIDPNRAHETPEMTPPPEESAEPAEETPAPTVEPTAVPTVEPTPAPTEAPAEVPDEVPASDSNHEHIFRDTWYATADSHWRECDCGQRTDVAAHDMLWTTVSMENSIAHQEGVCRVCGYRDAQDVTLKGSMINRIPMPLIGGALFVLLLALVIAETVKRARRR